MVAHSETALNPREGHTEVRSCCLLLAWVLGSPVTPKDSSSLDGPKEIVEHSSEKGMSIFWTDCRLGPQWVPIAIFSTEAGRLLVRKSLPHTTLTQMLLTVTSLSQVCEMCGS